MSEALNDLEVHLADRLGAALKDKAVAFGELTIAVGVEDLLSTLEALRDDPRTGFTILISICGADYPAREQRFDVVYHLLSMTQNLRLRVKIAVDEVSAVPSAHEVFPAATWYERETYDMYGVLFSGNPDMRRLLTDYGFDGHPLRKDFPLTGFVEVRYDDGLKRVVYEPVKLNQEFRDFDFLSPWEGTDYVLPGDEKAGRG